MQSVQVSSLSLFNSLSHSPFSFFSVVLSLSLFVVLLIPTANKSEPEGILWNLCRSHDFLYLSVSVSLVLPLCFDLYSSILVSHFLYLIPKASLYVSPSLLISKQIFSFSRFLYLSFFFFIFINLSNTVRNIQTLPECVYLSLSLSLSHTLSLSFFNNTYTFLSLHALDFFAPF